MTSSICGRTSFFTSLLHQCLFKMIVFSSGISYVFYDHLPLKLIHDIITVVVLTLALRRPNLHWRSDATGLSYFAILIGIYINTKSFKFLIKEFEFIHVTSNTVMIMGRYLCILQQVEFTTISKECKFHIFGSWLILEDGSLSHIGRFLMWVIL